MVQHLSIQAVKCTHKGEKIQKSLLHANLRLVGKRWYATNVKQVPISIHISWILFIFTDIDTLSSDINAHFTYYPPPLTLILAFSLRIYKNLILKTLGPLRDHTSDSYVKKNWFRGTRPQKDYTSLMTTFRIDFSHDLVCVKCCLPQSSSYLRSCHHRELDHFYATRKTVRNPHLVPDTE